MKKEHNYVLCQRCDNWDEAYRSKQICPACKNTKQVIDPQERLCNLCSGCVCPIGTHNEQFSHGLFEAEVSGGYDSYHLLDTTNYKFSLCEKCLRNIFIQCKIPPTISSYMGGTYEENQSDEEKWKEDQQCYEYRVWRDDGGYHQAYLDRKCNAVKECPNEALYTVLHYGDFSEDSLCDAHKDKKNHYSGYSLTKFIPNVLKPFL